MRIYVENLFLGCECRNLSKKAQLPLSLTFNGPEGPITVSGAHMSAIISDTQSITARIAPKDAKGNPAPLDGVPAWTVADESLVEIMPADDGLSALLTAVGPLGTTQIHVQADADLGEGVVTIEGLTDITVIAGQAVSLDIAFDPQA